ncbi:hypothetical protein KOAAANKH_00778 [Brevundimonas sp. NIBR10]|uniref:ABC transporter permease n=1 Tax=Brevundimonas sp. NIBR10 TaxID=3015997 RepID=UPI0022F17114|nr:DUF3526 domain-containing protein [Brevundimonas sp. NIBR10]WGM45913.1 hypothetical protein KOAAANKH_00778 [Brevundimonas sp. NIBR10]
MRLALIGRIAREDWREAARSRVALLAGALLAILTLSTVVLGIDARNAMDTARARYQAQSDTAFDAQPDRHPHRMVHYGQFVFRPLPPLAFFDPGVDPFTGSTVFLEGHRQNSANFAQARQSSLVSRLGPLSPAFVLQTLAPLLIIFLGFGAITRERERGTLRLLLAQGLTGGELIAGKMLGHLVLTGLVGMPALIALAVAVAAGWAPLLPAALMALAYGAYLAIWSVASVLASAFMGHSRNALTTLVCAWMVLVVLLPRALPEVAAARIETPTRIETDVAIARELKALGDSHDPDDPHFAAFKAETLRRYGVATTDALPVQWAGLVGMEGERLTSGLFDRHFMDNAAREARQNGLVRSLGVVSPLVALRQSSMSLAGTDLESHQDFLIQVERFRYAFVQRLNLMQAELIPGVNAGEDPRISADHWRAVPRFAYRPPDVLRLGANSVALNFAVLALWLAALTALSAVAARRLERIAR